jgi:hypothetical protein
VNSGIGNLTIEEDFNSSANVDGSNLRRSIFLPGSAPMELSDVASSEIGASHMVEEIVDSKPPESVTLSTAVVIVIVITVAVVALVVMWVAWRHSRAGSQAADCETAISYVEGESWTGLNQTVRDAGPDGDERTNQATISYLDGESTTGRNQGHSNRTPWIRLPQSSAASWRMQTWDVRSSLSQRLRGAAKESIPSGHKAVLQRDSEVKSEDAFRQLLAPYDMPTSAAADQP